MVDNAWDPVQSDDQPPAGQADTQSSDQSKSGLRKAWDAWSSKPENNAALLQFGIAMLQPRAPGQTGIGQFANAIGSGAEASSRNVAAQEEAAKQASEEGFKGREAGARELTARAYADQVAQGGKKGGGGLQGKIATQRSFNQWLQKPEDPIAVSMNGGKSNDPIVQALQKQFPDVKSKGDLIGNGPALAAARRLFGASMSEPDEDTGEPTAPPAGGGGASASGAAAPAQPTKPVFKDGKQIGVWDPIKGYVPNGS